MITWWPAGSMRVHTCASQCWWSSASALRSALAASYPTTRPPIASGIEWDERLLHLAPSWHACSFGACAKPCHLYFGTLRLGPVRSLAAAFSPIVCFLVMVANVVKASSQQL
eukprot:SM002681S09988  [mRNA]  locus=s2681:629:964:+ [translate_table: standard]